MHFSRPYFLDQHPRVLLISSCSIGCTLFKIAFYKTKLRSYHTCTITKLEQYPVLPGTGNPIPILFFIFLLESIGIPMNTEIAWQFLKELCPNIKLKIEIHHCTVQFALAFQSARFGKESLHYGYGFEPQQS